VGLADLDDAAWIAHFGRFAPLPGNLSQPLALRYTATSSACTIPNWGMGAASCSRRCATAGRLMDLGTKGSGQTPWSRQGDGRLTLKGAMREVLATEMLEAGRQYQPDLLRDRNRRIAVARRRTFPTRAAVLVRLSHSHIRIGTFQRLGMLDAPAEMEQLVDYCLASFPGPALPPTRPSRTTRRPGCCTRWSNAWPTWRRATWSPASSMAC
jgi:uncharacterized protein YdiU (UPF0061 family)